MMPLVLRCLSNCLLALLFLLGGLALLVFWLSESFQSWVLQVALQKGWVLGVGALLLFAISGLLLLVVWNQIGQRYFCKSAGTGITSVNRSIFERYLAAYWRKTYPHNAIEHELTLKPQQVMIRAKLPSILPEEQQLVLEHMREEIQQLFFQFVGFEGKVVLHAEFEKK